MIEARVDVQALSGFQRSSGRGCEAASVQSEDLVRGVFKVARNRDADSTVPFVISVPLASGDLVPKANVFWPRRSKVNCHRAERWRPKQKLSKESPCGSSVRRGVAVDPVLDRARENRSQFVVTALRDGRVGIFSQSVSTTSKTRSAAGVVEIVVDDARSSCLNPGEQRLLVGVGQRCRVMLEGQPGVGE